MPNFTVDAQLPAFIRDLKQAVKRHPSILREDLPQIIAEIADAPGAFPALVGLLAEVRKCRIGVRKAGIGRSGGYRLLFQVDRDMATITLLAMYYKPQSAILPLDEIRRRLRM